MSVAWELRGPVLVVTTSGAYTNEEVDTALGAGAADPRRVPGTLVLFDGRQSQAKLTKGDMEWRAARLESLPRLGFGPRVAFVVNAQPHRFGLGRMLELRLEPRGVDVRIFSDMDQAWAWLAGAQAPEGCDGAD